MPQSLLSRGIWTIPDFFTRQECARWVESTERLGFAPAPVATEEGAVMLPELRNNDRLMVDDPALAADLWRRIAAHVPHKIDGWNAVGLNERFRCYRYEAGQSFDWHYDGSFRRPNGERSYLTLLIYLSDDCEGGETEFSDSRIEPHVGMAVLFLHRLLHRGAPVRQGRKYVLRTDVMYECPPEEFRQQPLDRFATD